MFQKQIEEARLEALDRERLYIRAEGELHKYGVVALPLEKADEVHVSWRRQYKRDQEGFVIYDEDGNPTWQVIGVLVRFTFPMALKEEVRPHLLGAEWAKNYFVDNFWESGVYPTRQHLYEQWALEADDSHFYVRFHRLAEAGEQFGDCTVKTVLHTTEATVRARLSLVCDREDHS